LLPHLPSLGGGLAIDLALDDEQGIDARRCFDADLCPHL